MIMMTVVAKLMDMKTVMMIVIVIKLSGSFVVSTAIPAATKESVSKK